MLRRLFSTALASGRSRAAYNTVRGLSSNNSDADDKKEKNIPVKNVIGTDVLDAVNAVVEDLHSGNAENKKRTRNDLISKLVAHEKMTFENATKDQTEELLSDKAMLDLIEDVSAVEPVKTPTAISKRLSKRGLVLLRKEIFYRAVQGGSNAIMARQIAERAVNEAEQILDKERKAEAASEKQQEPEKKDTTRSKMEQELFEYAMQMTEKLLYKDEIELETASRRIIDVAPEAASLFETTERLNLFPDLNHCQDKSLEFWSEWDRRAAHVVNQSMGSENSFEEQIEWTNKGMQWPYPIDNEYLLGEEEKVSFIEHIFLERHLARLGLPRDGPIGHFMELVCVGLSKNPYMSAAKKVEHLEWFGNYFNEEKQKLVIKLHAQEVQASANA